MLTILSCALTTAALAQSAAPAPGTEGRRAERQQDRIAQGVKSGQLTPRETAHLERREASVQQEKHQMRAQDDGHLTAGDRRALNQRQNRISKSIYRDKHNGRRQ
ncbi:MAG TPA: hypothetical protein VGD62_09430 [Acidobacteriaceae bacterium]